MRDRIDALAHDSGSTMKPHKEYIEAAITNINVFVIEADVKVNERNTSVDNNWDSNIVFAVAD